MLCDIMNVKSILLFVFMLFSFGLIWSANMTNSTSANNQTITAAHPVGFIGKVIHAFMSTLWITILVIIIAIILYIIGIVIFGLGQTLNKKERKNAEIWGEFFISIALLVAIGYSLLLIIYLLIKGIF